MSAVNTVWGPGFLPKAAWAQGAEGLAGGLTAHDSLGQSEFTQRKPLELDRL